MPPSLNSSLSTTPRSNIRRCRTGTPAIPRASAASTISSPSMATGARNYTACDSLLIGDKCGAHTVPYVEAKNSSATFEHEATTSKISEDVLFYCVQRGLSQEEAVGLVVNGFVKDVLQQLPMEFAVEAQKLISISLEGSVG